MKTVRPSSKEEFRRVVEEAKKTGKLVYIAAYPCPECEQFEASLEELGLDKDDRILKIDVPPDDWAVDYVLNELGVPGAPSVIKPDGEIMDDFDPVVLALRVARVLGVDIVREPDT